MEKLKPLGEITVMRNHLRRNFATAFLTALLSVCLLATTTISNAVDVYTDPVGFITLNGVGGATPKYSFQGLGLTQLPASRGILGIPSGTELPVNDPLIAGQFNFSADTNATHFIEITSGSNAGLTDDIVSNSTIAVFTASDISSLVASGQTYKVYPHWTIGKVFGPTNEVGLLGGTTASAADNILIWNPDTQGFTTYYFKTGGLGGTGWRSTASTSINRSNSVVYIDQGIEILRKTTGDVTNKLVGAVKLGSTITPIVGSGYTLVGNVYPAGITLAGSGLYTTNSATGLNGGTTASAADNILIWNPDTQGFATYYFKTGGLGGTGWRSTASTSVDAATNTIPIGAFATIQRKISGSFNWSMPQPFTNP